MARNTLISYFNMITKLLNNFNNRKYIKRKSSVILKIRGMSFAI